MGIRLVASDLDGTLFGRHHVPEPRTVAAVNAVVEAGMLFVAVTGRSHFGGAQRVTASGATAHWFIGSNGGHRLNMTTGVLEERLLFDAVTLDAIHTELPARIAGIGFGLEHEAGFSYDDRFRTVFPAAFDGRPRKDTAPRTLHDVGKIFIAHPTLRSNALIAQAQPHVPANTHVTTSGTEFIEITPEGADKAAGLARLCAQLGIAADEVIAFGDNNNDLTMLEWAGRGVAMANATSAVRAVADEITAGNEEFGVAQVLETLL